MKKRVNINTALQKKKPNTVFEPNQACPFCHKETMDQNVLLNRMNSFIWIENKYPTLDNTYQTVLLEHTDCGENISTYEKSYLYQLIEWSLSKWEELENSGKFKSVLFFKNHGKQADSSIQHAHMQLIGLCDIDYREELTSSQFEGITIAQKEGVTFNVSTRPVSEFYEFNVMVEESLFTHVFSDFLQDAVTYILTDLNLVHQSFNIAFYKWEGKLIAKIISRKPASILLLGYGISQVPSDVNDVRKNIQKKFHYFEEKEV